LHPECKDDKFKHMEKAEKAVQYFTEGFNCSQSVFTAIAEGSGMDKKLALKIASGFGGGIARTQKTCGAVTGAVMAISYLNGFTQPDASEQKERVYELIQAFINRFTLLHKTINCNELLGYSIQTEEGRKLIKELGLTETVCSRCVNDAVLIVEGLQK
jgi:C_GCAxxG_C_C family probable redox protein